eukprot:scaffold2576_cov418-Prasinococcus_capsulatus_cf.AAC.1
MAPTFSDGAHQEKAERAHLEARAPAAAALYEAGGTRRKMCRQSLPAKPFLVHLWGPATAILSTRRRTPPPAYRPCEILGTGRNTAEGQADAARRLARERYVRAGAYLCGAQSHACGVSWLQHLRGGDSCGDLQVTGQESGNMSSR